MPKMPIMGAVGSVTKVAPKGLAPKGIAPKGKAVGMFGARSTTPKTAISRKPTAVKIRRSSFNPKTP
jgi:hypothetical protein